MSNIQITITLHGNDSMENNSENIIDEIFNISSPISEIEERNTELEIIEEMVNSIFAPFSSFFEEEPLLHQYIDIPDEIFDPQNQDVQRETLDLERLNEVCPERDFDLECTLECNEVVHKVRKLPCDHIFCSKCIQKWITESSNSCPICREIVN